MGKECTVFVKDLGGPTLGLRMDELTKLPIRLVNLINDARSQVPLYYVWNF